MRDEIKISVQIGKNTTKSIVVDGTRIITFNRTAAYKLGEFYLQKNGSNYQDTEAEVIKLRINDIQEDDNAVTIYTSRPGFLIGKRGENVDKIEVFFGKKVRIIEEEALLDHLIPHPPDFDDDNSDYRDAINAMHEKDIWEERP